MSIDISLTGSKRYKTAAIVIDPGLVDGVPTLDDEPSIYAVYDGTTFVGHVFAGPIPGSSNDAELLRDETAGDVKATSGWAQFRGPYRPLVRTPRIVSAPR